MVTPVCVDAGPILDQAFGLPAGDTGPLRSCSWHAAQQNQVGFWETHQSGARSGRPHQEGNIIISSMHLYIFLLLTF